ncbi:MAG TPA: hypothetical protein VN622_10930 [Clostridia bacterium]|nr:hypothetical protein [Clostridia bacterium]
MDNLNAGTVAEVLVGPVKFYVAPKGTELPTTTDDTVTWPEAWENPGYTEDGLQMSYTPTIVEITVDEEPNPVDEILDKEKSTLSVKLAQNTFANMKLAISASKLTASPASATEVGTETLSVGGGTLDEVMVGFQGKNELGFWRVFIGYRAKAKANLQMSFKRNGKQIIPVEFSLLADSTKPAGENVFKIVQKKAPKTA